MKRAAGTAALLVMPVLVMLLGALLFYGIGNGLSPGAVALLLLAVVLAAVPLAVQGIRRAQGAVIGLGLLLVGFAVHRVTTCTDTGPIQHHQDGVLSLIHI